VRQVRTYSAMTINNKVASAASEHYEGPRAIETSRLHVRNSTIGASVAARGSSQTIVRRTADKRNAPQRRAGPFSQARFTCDRNTELLEKSCWP
jgi:hypothetical protein